MQLLFTMRKIPFPNCVNENWLLIQSFVFRFRFESTDDIPIQAGDESGAGNVSQLISITEESEPTGSSSTTETQLGMRNNLVRSSKEILKTHKVPFLQKRIKEKDKNVSTTTRNLS